jgi:hypothetical protein
MSNQESLFYVNWQDRIVQQERIITLFQFEKIFEVWSRTALTKQLALCDTPQKRLDY